MQHCAHIASRRVCSDDAYIIYGFTAGLVGGSNDCVSARRIWNAELAGCRERGHESDALLFEWNQGHWMMCGSLYDLQAPGAGVLAASL